MAIHIPYTIYITYTTIYIYYAELYAELISKRYYAAFAWSLLNCIVDINVSPPQFRKAKLMKGMAHGADMESVSEERDGLRGKERVIERGEKGGKGG